LRVYTIVVDTAVGTLGGGETGIDALWDLVQNPTDNDALSGVDDDPFDELDAEPGIGNSLANILSWSKYYDTFKEAV
jgi:hypothetical protein